MDDVKNDLQAELSPEPPSTTVINARVTIHCLNCSYKKSFRNKFRREDIEMIIVSTKILDWMSCERCGNPLSLKIEYDI